MQVHLFRSTGRIFGATADAGGDSLPAKYAPWTAFKTVEMTHGVPMPGIDPDECLDDIDKYGFHVTDAHVRITETLI